MKDVIYPYIPEIPDTALRAALVLEFFEKADAVYSLTVFAEAAGLSVRAFEGALSYMQERPLDNPFVLEYTGDTLTLNPKFFIGKQMDLLKKDTSNLGKHIKELTIEVVKNSRQRAGGRTTITSSGEEGVAVERITQALGRGLIEEEAFILGKCMSSYGPERVKNAFFKATGKSRIHSMSAILYNGALGKGAKEREPKQGVTYQEL